MTGNFCTTLPGKRNCVLRRPQDDGCRSQWSRRLRRRSAAARLLRLWVWIPPGAWTSVVSIVCCQVEVSATDWSLSSRGVLLTVVRRYVWSTRVGTLIVATIYLQLIQNRYMFRSFTVLQCSHQHCVQPVASDVKVVGYLYQPLLCW